MDKFWGSIALLMILGLTLLSTAEAEKNLVFTELDKECRENKKPNSLITVKNNSIHFEGRFHVKNLETNIKHDFKQSNQRLTLKIKTGDKNKPENFYNSCLGIATFKAHTKNLERGTYLVQLKIDGETKQKTIIELEK